MNVHSFPVSVVYVKDQWEARCEELNITVCHPNQKVAEGRLLVQVYRYVADSIASAVGDIPETVGMAFLVSALEVAYKALSGQSEQEKTYALELIKALGQGKGLKEPFTALQYEPDNTTSAPERVNLALLALSETRKQEMN